MTDTLNTVGVLGAIDVVLLDLDRLVDDLITKAYETSSVVNIILTAIRDPAQHRWLRLVRPLLRVLMIDFKLVGNRIYYCDHLFIPFDQEELLT